MEDDEDFTPLDTLPTEILLHIFSFLPVKNLTQCREVCSRWKNVIDTLNQCHSMWRNYCATDFKTVYKYADIRSKPHLSFYELYRSLALWRQLHLASQHYDEFASASSVVNEIQGLQYLKDGVIGVNTKEGIVYYNLDTLERTNRNIIYGDYNSYVETNDTVILVNIEMHLMLFKKILRNPSKTANVTYDNCKAFNLINNIVYFVNLDDKIFSIDLDDKDLKAQFIVQSGEGVMCLGFTENNLNIITFLRNIYTLVGRELQPKSKITTESNLIHELVKYNLVDHFDWSIYVQWMFSLCFSLPEGPLRDIVTIKSYGDLFFIGSDWGVLRIYYSPYTNGELDFVGHTPVKQYNFMERYDCPVLCVCPIMGIEIIEIVDGHIVIVAMPKKVAILKFTHFFKKASTLVMLPNNELHKVQLLNIEEEVGAT